MRLKKDVLVSNSHRIVYFLYLKKVAYNHVKNCNIRLSSTMNACTLMIDLIKEI